MKYFTYFETRSYTTGDIEGFGVELSTGYDLEEGGVLCRSTGYEDVSNYTVPIIFRCQCRV